MMVYVIAGEHGPVKVGMAGSPASRLAALQTASAQRLRLTATYDLGDRLRARTVERIAHGRLGARHLHGEWFSASVQEAAEAVEHGIATVDAVLAGTPTAMIEPAQIRAARALLGWTMDDLSGRAGVSLASIKNIERGATDPKVSTLQRIQSALEAGGLTFLDAGDTRPGGKGVRFR